MAVVLFPLTANAIDVWGDQWGTWTRDNSPYNVVGEIRVPPESTLVIEPGIVVNFQGHYKFIVDSLATLTAVGTDGDSIVFTPEDTATGWHGIRFNHADSLSQVSYCRIEYGRASGPDLDRYGGGIFCYYASPTITFNTIVRNSALERGGGICCFYSNPLIRKNRISDNFAKGGSGIFCSESNPTIRGNIIAGNVAESRGGGIYCHRSSPHIVSNTFSGNSVGHSGGAICCYEYSNPTIRNNIIEGNSCVFRGGGIHCRDYSSPTITRNYFLSNSGNSGGGIHCLEESNAKIKDCFFKDNSAGDRGGAIFCRHSNPIITRNIVIGNSALNYGGGICCAESTAALITGNTLSGNSADSYGGGIACWNRDCYPDIRNTILWGNSAPTDPEIFIHNNSDPTITYCNIQGGHPGRGNIDADPLLAGLERDDVNIRWRSPCIDAGDPNSPLDPDNTVCDMGRFYFNQDVMGVVEVYPHDEPIVLPPEGGQLVYDGWVFNFIGYPGRADIWTYAFVPGIGRYGPIDLYPNFRIPPDSIGMNDIRQNVPGLAPAGEYVLAAYVGSYPSTIIDSSYFYFSKSGSVGGGITGWFEGDEWLKGGDLAESNLPSAYALSQNYPNPFNATTVIEYALPVESHVKLQVYNIRGQKVATLVDSKQQAGYRSVNWDASKVSSGIYFYKLTAGSKVFSDRMMLLK